MVFDHSRSPRVELWREAAVALAEYACGWAKGRSKDDPVYVEVTEGRDGPTPEIRAKYSSCADLGHWLLYRLGCREPWLNRQALKGLKCGPPTRPAEHRGWMPGVNVSRLAAAPFARTPRNDWVPQPGDIMIVYNTGLDAHVCVVLELRDVTDGGGSLCGSLTTANFGAGGMSPKATPGARIVTQPLASAPAVGGAPFGTKFLYGPPGRVKRVQRFLSIENAIPYCNPSLINLDGAVLPGEFVEEFEVTSVGETPAGESKAKAE